MATQSISPKEFDTIPEVNNEKKIDQAPEPVPFFGADAKIIQEAIPEIQPIPQTEQTPQSSAPEQHVEQLPQIEQNIPVEIKEEAHFLEETINTLKQKLRLSKKKPTQIPQVKNEMTVQIERIMEEGLADAYKELTPVQKQEFKIKGEETAWKIQGLLKQTHIKIKEIFKLILEWLKMLPGINRFFLEQEAKIKVDKIISLKKYKG